MKFLGILLLVVLFSASTYADFTSVISNTAHNFATASWNDANTGGTGKQICQPCHTPHNAKLKLEALWNHAASPDNYIMWEGETTNGVTTYDVGETSKLCLDCHDGQIAMSAFGGGSGTGNQISGSAGTWGSMNLGTDLTDDHPINVPARSTPYTTVNGVEVAKPNTEFKNGTYYMKPISGWDGVNNTTTYGSGKLRLTNTGSGYNVDCQTCHTPHGSARGTNKADVYPFLLRMDNGASALCQACHAK